MHPLEADNRGCSGKDAVKIRSLFPEKEKPGARKSGTEEKKRAGEHSRPLFMDESENTRYQITTRLEGARYIPSVFLTWKVAYHSGKFLGGMLVRR